MRPSTMWSSGILRWRGRLRRYGRRSPQTPCRSWVFLYGMMGPGILAHKGKPGDAMIDTTRKYLTEVMRNPHEPALSVACVG